jgi:hypothetical protein
VTSCDPDYITPDLKSKLRRKNRLKRTGRTEEAETLARQVDRQKELCSKAKLEIVNGTTDVKLIWSAVRKLTGRKLEVEDVVGIAAESLNRHYANISSDSNCQARSNRLPVLYLLISNSTQQNGRFFE